MLQMCNSNARIGYLSTVCVRLLLVLWLFQSTEATKRHTKLKPESFSHIGNWSLNSLGRLAADTVEDFLTRPVYSTIEYAINETDNDENKFFKAAFADTLVQQTLITSMVVISSLIAFLLLPLPYFISLYRSKQAKFHGKGPSCFPTKRIGWFMFEVFMICSTIALFGAIVLSISSIRAHKTLRVPFEFAETSMDVVFDMKDLLQRNYQTQIRKISQNTFISTSLLFDVNDRVGTKFMEVAKQNFTPIWDSAVTLNYAVLQSLETLDHLRNHLYEIRNSMNASKVHANEFTTAVNKLINASAGSEPDLKRLLVMPSFNVSLEAIEKLKKPIDMLTEASKSNFQAGYQEAYYQLQLIALDTHFHPIDLIAKLQLASLNLEKKLRLVAEKYITFVQTSLMNDNEVAVYHQIREVQSNSLHGIRIFLSILTIIGIVCTIVIIASIVSYIGIICVSENFRINNCPIKKIFVQNTIWTKRAGQLLLFCCYAISCILWICCVLNVVLYLFASLSQQICMTLRDKTIFNATVDRNSLQNDLQWHSIFTSPESNSTLKDCIERCSNDPFNACVTFLPDTVLKSDRDKLLSELVFNTTIKEFEKNVTNLVKFNTSSVSSLKNMTNILDDMKLDPLFKTLKDISDSVVKLNAVTVLKKLEKSVDYKKVAELVGTALKAYRALKTELNLSNRKELELKSEFKTVISVLNSVEGEKANLVRISDALHSFIIKEGPSIYSSILRETIKELVDGSFMEVKNEMEHFRKYMSYCDHLSIFYQSSKEVFCIIITYPISVCLISSFLLWVFLLPAVWMCVPVVHLFAEPPLISESVSDEETNTDPALLPSEPLDENDQGESISNDQESSTDYQNSEAIEMENIPPQDRNETPKLDNEQQPSDSSPEKLAESNLNLDGESSSHQEKS